MSFLHLRLSLQNPYWWMILFYWLKFCIFKALTVDYEERK